MNESIAIGPTALGTLVIGAVWGVLLLGFGAALLRPMIVLAAILVGIVAGVVAVREWVPTLPLWIAASAGGVLGLLAGALLYRPTVAAASACLGGVAGAMVAWAVIAGGALDTQPRNLEHGLVTSKREQVAAVKGAEASTELLAVFLAAPAAEPPQAAATPGDRVLRDLTDIASRGWKRACAALGGTAPAYRTLLFGSIATGMAIGLIAGFMATTLVARVLTSLAGAALLLCAGTPLLAVAGYAPLPQGARAWLLATGALVVVGVALQTLIAGKSAAKKGAQAPPRAAPAAA